MKIRTKQRDEKYYGIWWWCGQILVVQTTSRILLKKWNRNPKKEIITKIRAACYPLITPKERRKHPFPAPNAIKQKTYIPLSQPPPIYGLPANSKIERLN